MKYRIYTLGCKVNQYESEAMGNMLDKAGYERAVKGESADIVLINSCTVTAQSDHKVRQTLHRSKKDNPDSVAILTGCMVQAFPEESTKLEDADIILGNRSRKKLCEHISTFLADKKRIIDIPSHQKDDKFESMSVEKFSERTRAFIKIEDGCNRFCSYCIIPYARGRVRSKPLDELVSDVKSLAENGYKEVVLTGINLSCYGQEFGLNLCDAVEAVCKIDGIERVRLGSLEPEMLPPDVISRLAEQKKLCPQFHLSLQSGSDGTLKRMNRHYLASEYKEIVDNLRNAFENASITTDIMVGFAGETDEEFLENLKFAEDIKFAKVHVFAYSRRPGTRAYDMPEQISQKEKERRSKLMIETTLKSQQDFFQTQLGRIEPVLFERRRRDGKLEGYTRNYTHVVAECDENLQGEIRNVRLLAIAGENIIGKIVEK